MERESSEQEMVDQRLQTQPLAETTNVRSLDLGDNSISSE
jgi:hypothetical protein